MKSDMIMELREQIAPVALLTEVAQLIVSRPELVRVESHCAGESLQLDVELHGDDVELLTGRALRSLRTVVATCAKIHGLTLESLRITPLPGTARDI